MSESLGRGGNCLPEGGELFQLWPREYGGVSTVGEREGRGDKCGR